MQFELKKYTFSATAKLKNISNKPSHKEITKLKQLHQNLTIPLMKGLKLKYILNDYEVVKASKEIKTKALVINSGFRTPQLCKAIGSRTSSQHAKAEALDIEVPSLPNLELFHWCRENLTYDQLILENHKFQNPSSGWVHISKVSNRGMSFHLARGGKLTNLSYKTERVLKVLKKQKLSLTPLQKFICKLFKIHLDG